MPPRPLFVGIGSPNGDDRIGWAIADELSRLAASVSVLDNPRINSLSPAIRKAANPADLLDWLDDIGLLVVCDACRGIGPPGTVSRWVWPRLPAELTHPSGTHQLSLASVLELASVLNRLPGETVIWGIQIESQEQRLDLSHSVAAALPAMVARVWEELTRV